MSSIHHRTISILAFSFFDAWLLSFAYEGQTLYALFEAYHVDPGNLMLHAIIFHAAGLFACGFIIKNIKTARKIMLTAAGLCIAGSGVFFFAPSVLWTISLPIVAFLAGLWNAAWGWFYRRCSSQNQRMGTVAASIAIGTTLMIGLNMTAIHLLPQVGLSLSMLCLAVSLVFIARLPKSAPEVRPPSSRIQHTSILSPFALLCLFIIVITINSGLMFQVVNPAFAHLTTLTSWYWAIPYIAALVIIARLPQKKVNRSYVLYAALAIQGFGFIAFLLLDRTAVSYLVVNTLLLGAFGINDLFWWSILGEMLDFHNNPAKLMGLGLSANVAGVLLGELIAGLVTGATNSDVPTLMGLAVVCVALVILPPLHKQLTKLLRSSEFFAIVENMSPEQQQQTMEAAFHAAVLTERENQIAALLLKGYTYRLISEELFISESTVKTHIQNIYYKLGVRSKTDLIQKLIK